MSMNVCIGDYEMDRILLESHQYQSNLIEQTLADLG